jgi:hydrogenase maturation protease
MSPLDCRLSIVDCRFKSKVESRKSKILIVGVGNPLLGDEGVGLHAVRDLSRLPMPAEVVLLDCGCDLLNLVSYLPDRRCYVEGGPPSNRGLEARVTKIIILDAIRTGGEPGRIYRFELDELEIIQTNTRSAHQLQTVDALRLLRAVCPWMCCCEIVVMGVEPKVIQRGGVLSPEVQASIVDLTRLVFEEL